MMTHEGGYRPSAVVRSIGLSAATRPYRAYRDSGVNRLGRVPEHWEVRRLKHSLGVNVAVLPEDTEPDYEFRYIDIGSVGTGELVGDPKPLRFETAPSRARRVVGRGDTLVSTVRTYLKAVWHAEDDVRDLVASTGFAVLTPKPWILPKFVGYACQSEPFTNGVTAESVGVVYPAIAEARLASALRLCIPPLPEQRAIVRFLDHADRRIQRFVRAKERLIELLEEQKQAIIHQAVTGRIDVRTGQPYPTYKDSGVEWLGEVPEHWEVGPLKRFVARQPGAIKAGPFGSQLTSAEMAGADYKVYTQRNVIDRDLAAGDKYISRSKFEEMRAFEVRPGDVLITSRGTIGRTALATQECRAGILHPCLLRVQVEPSRLSRRFLMTLVQDSALLPTQLVFLSNATTIDVIYSDTLANVVVPVPSHEEQRCIVEHLSHRVGAVERAIRQSDRQLELVNEYRTRLIADVVTGKLDVGSAAASLPETDPLTADHPTDHPETQTTPLGDMPTPAHPAPHP